MRRSAKSRKGAPRKAWHDFAPGLIGIERQPPSPLPRIVLWGVLLLCMAALVWAIFGRLDIVAVAEGKLVPVSYLKIVQPAEGGIVREIAVRDGDRVKAGQVLVRMDAKLSQADTTALLSDLQHQGLELRRIEAELAGLPFGMAAGDAAELYRHVEAKHAANRRALEDALSGERAALEKARQELAATQEVRSKLQLVLPAYRAQEEAYARLARTGFAGNLMVLDKQRERIEKEQDLRTQEHMEQGLRAAIQQSERRLAQIGSGYRQQLQGEKVTTYAALQRLRQDWEKQQHRNALLELRAPQAGIVKDLATHTAGTVVTPGVVLMTLVPDGEALQAEVWTRNEDAGFVRAGLPVKIKLAAYPFQKYGMVDGGVIRVSADASDASAERGASPAGQDEGHALAYRTLVALDSQTLHAAGRRLALAPGMRVVAEIRLGDQGVLEYLLSPVRQAFHEAGRER